MFFSKIDDLSAVSGIICFIIAILFFAIGMTSCCTFSFHNVLTDGTATDVIDDAQSIKSDPDVSPNVSIPAL